MGFSGSSDTTSVDSGDSSVPWSRRRARRAAPGDGPLPAPSCDPPASLCGVSGAPRAGEGVAGPAVPAAAEGDAFRFTDDPPKPASCRNDDKRARSRLGAV